MFQIHIKCVGSDIADLDIDIAMKNTVDELQDLIAEETNLKYHEYKLVFAQKEFQRGISMTLNNSQVMKGQLHGGAGKRKTLTGMVDYTPLVDDHNRVLQVLQYRAPGYEAFLASLSPSQFAGWVAHVMKQKNFERIIEFTANEMLLKKQFQDMIQLTLTIKQNKY